ncbi:hypothetical protein [Micromonospora sp. KC721]|uniref:hypothetical protein n=1 Tax=Micromonospora sp. KC721 TaxID=2530380 RepID=UPI0014047AC3|nr:hypothetical protein [Micromonospora sp. KC721]
MLTIALTDLTGEGHPDLLGLAPDGTLFAFANRVRTRRSTATPCRWSSAPASTSTT